MKLFKIAIYSESARYETYRYGTLEKEVIERLRAEYKRYKDKKSDWSMTAEEVQEK
ncbi:hypothetical protein HXZ52_11265 [Clostridium cadaveris]|nr:hypothetical protein [Clostridium cadaveris]